RARRSLLALRAGGSTDMLPAGHPSVLAYRRAHPRIAPFLSLTNFSDVTQSADAEVLARAGLHQPVLVHSSTVPSGTVPSGSVPSGTGRLELAGGRIELPPWGFAWLSGA